MIIQQAALHLLEELALLFDFYRKTLTGATDLRATTLFVENLVKQKSSVIFIAQPDITSSDIFGFANLYPSFSTLALQRLWILNDLFVDEKARGKGIANVLFQHIVAFAANSGAVRIELKTEINNHGARELYKSLNFEIDDQQHLYYRIPL